MPCFSRGRQCHCTGLPTFKLYGVLKDKVKKVKCTLVEIVQRTMKHFLIIIYNFL
jgi:hypothetical protein